MKKENENIFPIFRQARPAFLIRELLTKRKQKGRYNL